MFARPALAWALTVCAALAPAALLRAQDETPPPRHVFYEGHAGRVYAVRWTGDGKTFLSGAADGTVRVWDRETGAAIHVVSASAPVLGLAVRPDGEEYAVAGRDGRVRLFDLPRRYPRRTITGVPGVPSAVACTSDGAFVITGDDAKKLRLWEAASGDKARDFDDVSEAVTAVAVSPDDTHVLATCADGSLRSWKLEEDPPVAVLFSAPASALAVHPERPLLALGGADGRVRYVEWPPATPEELQGHSDEVTAVAMAGDGSLVVSGGNDSAVRLTRSAGEPAEVSLPGQPGKVTSLALSKDGGLVVSGGDEGAVKLWTTAEAQEAGTLLGHDGAVTAVAVGPGGERLASGGADGTLRVWRRPVPPAAYEGHEGSLTRIVRHPESGRLFTAGSDKTVRVWKAADGEAVKTLGGAENGLTALAVSADGKLVATGDSAGAVRVLKVADGSEAATWTAHEGAVSGLSFSTDGKQLTSSGADGAVHVWAFPPETTKNDEGEDVVQPARTIAADEAKVHGLVRHPDGKRLATAGEDGLVKLWKPDGTKERQYGKLPAAVGTVAFNGDGTWIAGGGDPLFGQKEVRVWETANGKPVQKLSAPEGVTSFAFAGGGRLVVACSDKRVRVYDVQSGRLLEEQEVPAPLVDLSVAKDGRAVAGAAGDGKVYVVTLSLEHLLAGHEGDVRSLAYTADGRLLSAGKDGKVRLWDLEQGQPAVEFTGSPAVVRMRLTADGTHVLAAGEDKQVRVWSLEAAQGMQKVPPLQALEHPENLRSVAGGGGRVFAGGNDDRIHVWDRESGALLERLDGHEGRVSALAVSADGRTVVSGSGDKTVRRWRTSVVRSAAAHEGAISEATFSADGTSLWTAGEDAFVRQWPLEGGAATRELKAGGKPLRTASVDGAGKLVAAGGDDGQVRVWSAEDGKPVATLEAGGAVRAVRFSADGTRLVAAGQDTLVRNFAVRTTDDGIAIELSHTMHGHEGPVTGLALAGDGRTLFSVSADQTLRRWVAAGHVPRREITAHEGPVFDLAWKPGTNVLATAGGDGRAGVWDAATGSQLQEFAGHTHQVTGVTFAGPEGPLVSTSLDGTLRTWPLPKEPPPEGEKPQEGEEPEAPLVIDRAGPADGEQQALGRLLSVATNPNGSLVLAAGSDGAWFAWNRQDAAWQRTVQGHNHPLRAIRYNAEESRIGTLDVAGEIRTWQTDGGLRHRERLPVNDAYGLAYAPNGTELLVGTGDGRVLRVVIPEPVR